MEEKTQEEIERYLHNEMNIEERSVFEKKIKSDELLKEEVLLQIAIHESFEDPSIQHNQNIYNIDLINDIKQQLKSDELRKTSKFIKESTKKHKNSNKKTIKLVTKFIASIAAIFLISFMLFYNSQQNSLSLYNEYADWNNLPSLIEKGESNTLSELEILYNAKKYKKIIALNIPTNKAPYELIYIGTSYVKLNDFKNASITFDKLINTNSLESSRGYWYKLLIHLNQNKLTDAKKILAIILNNKENYNYTKAKELSEKIKNIK